MQDRKYQVTHIEKIVEAVSTKRKVLAQLPTGGGKTVEFSLIAQRFCRSTGKSVLILVHRQELMKQAARTIKEVMGVDARLITSKTKKYHYARVYIGMVESTLSRLALMDNIGLVIIDECHIANFNKIHSIFLEELIIGFSATPVSSSKKQPLNKFYSCAITGPQIKTLIADGFLAQNITRCPKNIVDVTQFEIDKLKGDYKESSMMAEFKLPKHVNNVIHTYNKFCFQTKTVVFNVNIEHSIEVTQAFQACRINARHLDSNCSDEEREEILEWFKYTPDAVLCNVMIATVGFDEPSIRNVILNFSTLSLTKFIQCCGRGSRSLPDKHYFNIIDMGGNCIKFGDWNDDRDWEYIFENPSIAGDGVAPVKNCPECEGLLHAAIMTCPLKNSDGELCLYEFEKRKTAEEQDMEEMILITKGIDIESLIQKNSNKYQYYTFFELAVDVIDKLFETYGYEFSQNTSQKHFDIYYKLCCDWWKKTMAGIDGNIPSIENSAWHIRTAKNNYNDLITKRFNTYTKQSLTA